VIVPAVLLGVVVGAVPGLRPALRHLRHIIWTGFIGLRSGIVPGASASIASFVAYQQARMWSRQPESFGRGNPLGVIAAESANNGVTSRTLVPLMAIGVPGGSTAAVMMVLHHRRSMRQSRLCV
jgi:putative tricarboxylic transport membrane protein